MTYSHYCCISFDVIQIRDFEYSPEAQESRKQELEKLIQDQDSLGSSLLQWCYASYGEVLDISFSLPVKSLRSFYILNYFVNKLLAYRFSVPRCTFVLYVYLQRAF